MLFVKHGDAKAVAKKAVERVGNAIDGIIEGLSGDN